MDFKSPRRNSTDFPQADEINALLQREAKRPPASGKENLHHGEYQLVIKWLELLGLPTTAFSPELTLEEFIAETAAIHAQVAPCMLSLPTSPELTNLTNQITTYLGETDAPKPSDLIFVFGGTNIGRIKTAVELFDQQLAPDIFISGGAPIYRPNQPSEATTFRQWAIEHDVPEDHIFIHDHAISIADNVRGGLNVIDSLNLKHDSMILVITWFAMRRAWATIKKYTPDSTKLYRVNAEIEPNSDYAPDRWWQNETGIMTVFNEFAKLRASEIINSA